jgi:flagellar hook-length control protein FliK
MNSILSMLLPTPAGAQATPVPPSSDPSSTAQFKLQFGQAVAALTGAAAPAASATTAPVAASQGTSTAAAAQAATQADTLTAALQKKIADLLAKGETVAEIAQQLAASLASSLAAHFGGNPAEIQNQLQTAFVSALSPPSTGPPQSTADLASALAQRFRLVADVAAGVLGETGQSNRLFAGSISDAATTAGVQPAPQGPSGASPTSADSTAPNASALIADLTASPTPGDGKTVALNGAPALGSNGDTLLGRILARAAQSSQNAPAAPQPQAAASPVQTGPATGLTALALAAATAALASAAPAASASQTTFQIANPTFGPETPAALDSHVLSTLASASTANSGSGTAAAVVAAAPSSAVAAFLHLFTDALATPNATATDGKAADANGNSTGALLQTTVASSQAPTIGAFAPVQQALATDAGVANGAQAPAPPPSSTTVVPDSVIEQVLRGAFLNTVGQTSTVRLRLVPETLGDISVKLTVNGNSVDAQVTAQTPAAHDALVAGQAQLTRSLADAGLKLASFNVDLAGGFTSFQQQQRQSSQNASTGRRLLLDGVDTSENDENALLAAPNFGPPVLAGAKWSALNYLA